MSCQGDEVEAYVSEAYHTQTLVNVYEQVVNPISGLAFWPRTGTPSLLPP